ncbi:Calcipressin-domain-containing protein [Glomus cerebriforme]|uniref:Calcipressin-domain-containing protein n=1 Tax=Glomus cerebriforme TaxID=658196 RepID=A0A397SHH5_9GLOM|nr:Calcipressin-domain-containing protein [Glomus cerebriforme]
MSPCASHVLPSRIQIPEIAVTNTLIVTNLDRETFLPENLAELRDRLERHGKIYKIVPIKSFNRILAIFHQTNDARIAKTHCDRIEFLNKIIRIYYGQHTPIYDEIDSSRHLNVPELERNWLVSPPCSPPVGWTQIKEDQPNSNTLADDLVHALAHASLNTLGSNYYNHHDDIDDFSLDDNVDQDNNNKMQAPILTVVPCDSDSRQDDDAKVPLILIQDWDDSGLQDTKKTKCPKRNVNIQQTKAQFYPTLVQHTPTPTPRPPLIF